MSDKKEGQLFQFHIKICSVKMKMKFPCRMALQFNKQPITKQAPSTELNKFFFNEIVALRGEGDGYAFQILMSLYTEKGTKYTSGSMKLLSAELKRSKGERLVIPLTKCLDPQAFCELIVEGVTDIKDSQLKLSRSSSKVLNSSQKNELISPLPKKINSERFLIAQTRSQANFHPGVILGSQQKREFGPKSQVFKTFTKSPNSKFSNIKYATSNGNLLGGGMKPSQYPIQQGNSQRTSFDEGEVYRQGYLKLKEKFKKQTELLKQQTRKKMALQANQNHLKLQIVKMKVKSEEQEKQINEKNQKIKALSVQLSEYQKKDLDLAYVKQECNSLERKNKMQQETIASLLIDIESIKKMMVQRTQLDENTIQGLRQQIQLAKNKYSQLSYEYQLQIRAKENIILTKNNDIQLRNDTIERQKQLIKDFEQQAQAKLFDYEKSLSSQRNFFQLKIDEQKIKISSVEGEKSFVEQKLIESQKEIQKLNTSNASLQFKLKVLNQQLNQAGKQLTELKIIKDKYQQFIKEHNFLQQQFNTVRKNLEATLQHKQINLTDLLTQYEQGKQRAQKSKTEQQEKIRFLSGTIHLKEVEIDTLNNSLQKGKRLNESLSKENQSLREQNKLIREDLKNTQKRLIGFQSQYSSFQSQSSRECSNLKKLIYKLKEQRECDEKKIDQLRQKSQRQSNLIIQYEEKENQWKIKQRHYEQKFEKDLNKHKESSLKYDSIIKNHQNTINDNHAAYEAISNDNRGLRRKINQLQLAAIRDRELFEKSKKDLKLSEQKISLLQQQYKLKLQDQKSIQQKILFLQQKIGEKQHQLTKLREKGIEETAKSAKQSQINQLLNKDKLKLQKQNQQLINHSKLKELAEQKLRDQLKNHKEELVKEKMKSNKIENDFDKFKETINDIIRIEFTRILHTPSTTQKNTERLRQSQVSNPKSEKSHRSRVMLDAGSLSTTLTQKLHQAKNSLWKMVELNKILKQQNNKLMNHTQSETNKYQFAQLQLHRDIQLLQDQMNNIMDDKQKQREDYDQLIQDLNQRVKEKEAEVDELHSQIAEYQAIVNGLKTDFEVNNDLNDKKVSSLKQSASELNQRIEYLNLNVACLQDKNHQLQEKTIQQQGEIISYKQMLIKNEKILLDVKDNEAKLITSLESLKKQLKAKHQAYIQLQMHLNSEKESKQKFISMLQEEEKKCTKLNEFANSLILQKQKAIKGELQKSQQNNQLQNQLFELTHQRDLLQEENQTVKKKLEQSREENKTLNKTIKILEKGLAQEKSKSIRSLQKVKQRESDLQIKREYIKDLQQKYKQLRDKNYKQIRQLSNQLEDKNLIAINASKQLNDKIIKVESESKKRWEESITLQSQVQSLTQLLYLQKDKSEDQSIQINRLKEEKTALEEQIASREFALQQRVQQLNKLQEVVGQLRLQIHSLQEQCNSQQKQFNHHVAQLENDYNYKLEETATQNAHNQQILVKQNQQLKKQAQGLQQLLAKALHDHNSQNNDYQTRINSYQERFKKIEAQRLNTILTKNNEIKKITEEAKIIQQRLRQKEGEVRRLAVQIEHSKIKEAQFQAKVSLLTEQAKNKEKVFEKQIEGLKSKDKLSHQNKQKVIAGLHQNEVQVRKIISQALKKLVQNCCKADTEKVLTTMKGLQSSVIVAMMSKIVKE